MIRFQEVYKRFGRIQALDGVSATLPPGRVTALVGPNGSGKSTLMKCLLGLVRPDRGTIGCTTPGLEHLVDLRSLIGYSPQMPRFPENLRVGELLALCDGVRPPGPFAHTEPLFPLEGLRARRVRGLSGGTLQRIGAELAWRSGAPLLVLDEPTAGLDPMASSRLKDRLLADRRAGRTVLISSHVLADLEELADHVIVLLEGRLQYEGSLGQLLEHTGVGRLERAVARMMERRP